MPQTIYLPKKPDPFESLLPMVQNLFLLKIKHKMDMDVLDAETKLKKVELEEEREYQKTQKGLAQKQEFIKEGRKPIVGPQTEQPGEVANVYTQNRWGPATEKPAYKEGQLQDFKVGDQFIQYRMTKGKWMPTGRKAPRYKPGVTVNLKQSAASEREKLATGEAALDTLTNLRGLFDASYVGPVAGRIGKVKDIFGGNPQKQSEFNAATYAFKNQIIKEITGAQMSEVEAKRIMKQIPDVNDPPSVWKAKWNQSRRNIAVLRKKRLEVMRKSGIKTPKSTEEYDFEWIPGQGLIPTGGE